MFTKSLFIRLTIIFLLSSIASAQENSWRGLSPLYSDRNDVERLLGNPKSTKYRFEYKYEPTNEDVAVQYSTKRCDDGWDVPVESVLSISISSKTTSGKSLKELGLDESKLFHSIDDAFFGTWTDPVAGRSYYFENVDRSLINTRYIPKRADNNLRCIGFPPFTPEGYHFTMERHGLYDPKEPKMSGNLAAAFTLNATMFLRENHAKYRGYVVVYFDKRLPFREYKRRFNFVKNFTYERLGAPVTDLTLIEGGMRETSELEIYLLPKDWAPPAPAPTLPSPQFMKKQM